MNTETRDAYRRHRSAHPQLSASSALAWARSTPMPGITWDTDDPHAVLSGTARLDGFGVCLTVTEDSEPEPDGTFTDTYQDGAFPNPNFRPWNAGLNYHTTRWYLSGYGSTIEGHRRDLAAAGFDRHRAWLTAVQYLREEAKRAADPQRYVVSVTVSRHGIQLASESVYNVDVPDDAAEARRQLIDQGEELIGPAVHRARATMTTLAGTDDDPFDASLTVPVLREVVARRRAAHQRAVTAYATALTALAGGLVRAVLPEATTVTFAKREDSYGVISAHLLAVRDTDGTDLGDAGSDEQQREIENYLEGACEIAEATAFDSTDERHDGWLDADILQLTL